MSLDKINIIEPGLLNLPKNWTDNHEEEIEKAVAGYREDRISPELLNRDKMIRYLTEFLEDVFDKGKPYELTKYYRFLKDVYNRGMYKDPAELIIEKYCRLFNTIKRDKIIMNPVIITYDPDGFYAYYFEEDNQRFLIKVKSRYRIINGRHRIAIAIYLKMKEIPIHIIRGGLNVALTYWPKFIEEAESRYLKEIENIYIGGSGHEYHSRTNKKKEIIYNAVMQINPKTLVDIGCNTGKISYPFLNKGIKVTGIDITNKEDLKIKQNYNFIQQNIIKEKYNIYADVALFLSVYHHMVFNAGLKKADEIFYNILEHSEYLIFDSGNPEEIGSYRNHWVKKLQEHFKTEKELLDHFGLRYKNIGKYLSGYDKRNCRSIVIFDRDSIDK